MEDHNDVEESDDLEEGLRRRDLLAAHRRALLKLDDAVPRVELTTCRSLRREFSEWRFGPRGRIRAAGGPRIIRLPGLVWRESPQCPRCVHTTHSLSWTGDGRARRSVERLLAECREFGNRLPELCGVESAGRPVPKRTQKTIGTSGLVYALWKSRAQSEFGYTDPAGIWFDFLGGLRSYYRPRVRDWWGMFSGPPASDATASALPLGMVDRLAVGNCFRLPENVLTDAQVGHLAPLPPGGDTFAPPANTTEGGGPPLFWGTVIDDLAAAAVDGVDLLARLIEEKPRERAAAEPAAGAYKPAEKQAVQDAIKRSGRKNPLQNWLLNDLREHNQGMRTEKLGAILQILAAEGACNRESGGPPNG